MKKITKLFLPRSQRVDHVISTVLRSWHGSQSATVTTFKLFHSCSGRRDLPETDITSSARSRHAALIVLVRLGDGAEWLRVRRTESEPTSGRVKAGSARERVVRRCSRDAGRPVRRTRRVQRGTRARTIGRFQTGGAICNDKRIQRPFGLLFRNQILSLKSLECKKRIRASLMLRLALSGISNG